MQRRVPVLAQNQRKDTAMKKILTVCALVAFASSALASSKFDMLEYTVRVKVDSATGSGVVISSKGGEYIATASHVVKKHVTKQLAPDNKGMLTVYEPVTVQFFRYDNGKMVETIDRPAKIVAFDEKIDVAILEVVHPHSPITDGAIATADIGVNPEVFDEVYAVGAGLAAVPFPTKGIVSSLTGVSIEPEKDDPPFIQHTADIAHGFSGGGLFRYNPFSDKYEIIGVNVQIGVEMSAMGASQINFMSFAVKMDNVKELMRKNNVPY